MHKSLLFIHLDRAKLLKWMDRNKTNILKMMKWSIDWVKSPPNRFSLRTKINPEIEYTLGDTFSSFTKSLEDDFLHGIVLPERLREKMQEHTDSPAYFMLYVILFYRFVPFLPYFSPSIIRAMFIFAWFLSVNTKSGN